MPWHCEASLPRGCAGTIYGQGQGQGGEIQVEEDLVAECYSYIYYYVRMHKAYNYNCNSTSIMLISIFELINGPGCGRVYRCQCAHTNRGIAATQVLTVALL